MTENVEQDQTGDGNKGQEPPAIPIGKKINILWPLWLLFLLCFYNFRRGSCGSKFGRASQ
jgi:hypothetical protein